MFKLSALVASVATASAASRACTYTSESECLAKNIKAASCRGMYNSLEEAKTTVEAQGTERAFLETVYVKKDSDITIYTVDCTGEKVEVVPGVCVTASERYFQKATDENFVELLSSTCPTTVPPTGTITLDTSILGALSTFEIPADGSKAAESIKVVEFNMNECAGNDVTSGKLYKKVVKNLAFTELVTQSFGDMDECDSDILGFGYYDILSEKEYCIAKGGSDADCASLPDSASVATASAAVFAAAAVAALRM